MPSSGWSNVALDTHYYSIFTSDQLKWSNQQRIDGICSFTKSMTQGSLWTFTGEWTPAITDCAGSRFILGSRGSSIYEGTSGGTAIGSCANMTGSGANFSPEMKTFMRQYWEVRGIQYPKLKHALMIHLYYPDTGECL
jgi:glucan 1,3-beta-glucosidase